ncbi:MAG TPA: thiamine phosphate synthase [Vicinamibacteria bacterium]|nr:thiamine phosphate synthase [Vicinamibacteria bacterium]
MPGALPARPFVYPIVDAGALGGRSAAEAVRALAEGGASLVQLRAKGMPDGALLDLAREATAAARAAGIALIVDDRADVARLAGADGVHVGQDDLPPTACRAVLGAGALVGLSTHGLGQIEAGRREPVDYLAVGPVFPTRSKRLADPVVGPELVRRARALWPGPLVAIGGITPENAREVVEAGADGLAVISAVLAHDDLAEAVRRLRRALGPPG